MYKVFFNERTVNFGEDFSHQVENEISQFYNYTSRQELHEIINLFSSSVHIQRLYLTSHNMPLLLNEFKSWFKYIKAGGGIVFNPEGSFLIIKRNGVWDLPKGKLEKGEDLETAALREVNEETGLEGLVPIQPLVSTYHTYQLKTKWVLKKTRWFEMSYAGEKEPVLESREGITDYKWAKRGDTDFITTNTYGSILDVLRIRDLV